MAKFLKTMKLVKPLLVFITVWLNCITNSECQTNPRPSLAGVIHVVPKSSPCSQFYNETYLPTNQSVEMAHDNMHTMYPLVYTYCSVDLLPLLCSIHLPMYDDDDNGLGSRLSPCRGFCESVRNSCDYAIAQLMLEWPDEMRCSNFPSSGKCFMPTAVKSHPFCDFSSSVGRSQAPLFTRTKLSSREENERIFEMSTYLPFFHALQSAGELECTQRVSLFLCLSRFRYQFGNDGGNEGEEDIRPSRNFCLSFSNSSMKCSITYIKNTLQRFRYDVAIPELDLNCSSLPLNGFDLGTLSTLSGPSIIDALTIPKLNNVSISLSDPVQLHITWNDSYILTDKGGIIQEYGVLWRKYGEIASYQHVHSNEGSVTLSNLNQDTLYDILVTYVTVNGVPQPFTAVAIPALTGINGSCPSAKVGTVEASGVFSLPETSVGGRVSIACPYNPQVSASYECLYKDESFTDILWRSVDIKNCPYRYKRSQQLFELSQKFLNPYNVNEASLRLRNLSSPGTELFPGDIAHIATILENIVFVKEKVDEVADNVLYTVDNVLDARLQDVLLSQRKTNSSLRIVEELNTLLESINITEETSFQRTLKNYAVDLSVVNPRFFSGVTFSGIINDTQSAPLRKDSIVKELSDEVVVNSTNATTIRLPRTLFNGYTDTKLRPQTIILAFYKETKFFRVAFNESAKPLNSFVIAGSIGALPVSNLKSPVVITLANLKRGDKNGSLCSFWNFTQDNWTQDGCSFQGLLPDGRIVCNCDHLTNFAILMDIYPDDETSNDRILGLISYIGCAISLVGLVLTIITILLLRDIRCKIPGQILLNYCIALSLTLIVFLAAAERSKTSSMATCRAAAVALHYFLLVVFMWMAIEAFNMYLAFVKVLPSYIPKFILKCCVVAWGIPAVIVSITIGVALEDYGDSKHCRLLGVPFLVSFLAPVLLILLGNSIAFVLIFRSLLSSGNNVTATRKKAGFKQAQQGAAIVVLLGLTWLFGVLAINDAKLVFQYLFSIFNSLQGFLVFVFYCVLSEESRKKYKMFWRKKTRNFPNLGRKGAGNGNLKAVETPKKGHTASETNSAAKMNCSAESAFILDSSQPSQDTRRMSSFERVVDEPRQVYETLIHDRSAGNAAEIVEDLESAFTTKPEEIVLQILSPASIEYTVKGESRYVVVMQITLKNNAEN